MIQCPKIHAICPKIHISGHFIFLLSLFVDRANCHLTVQESSQSAFVWMRTGVPKLGKMFPAKCHLSCYGSYHCNHNDLSFSPFEHRPILRCVASLIINVCCKKSVPFPTSNSISVAWFPAFLHDREECPNRVTCLYSHEYTHVPVLVQCHRC